MPEAYNGGPIALIEDGDLIEIDREMKEVNLLISEETFSKRKINFSSHIKESTADTNLLKAFREMYAKSY